MCHCEIEAGEHVRKYLLAHLLARHAADGEERTAWHGAPGSRQAGTLGTGSGHSETALACPAQLSTLQDGALAIFLHGCPNRNSLSE